MYKFEEILDQAISRVKNGEEISAILLSCPAALRDRLSANLNLVKISLGLPKKTAPEPIKRRLFLRVQPESSLVFRFSQFFNLYAVALTTLILIIGGFGYAGAQSIPGDKLFSLKRTFENLQIKLASSPEAQAKLQLTFANARLQEAEQSLADKNYNQTGQVIEELNNQTEVALNNIQQIAANNPKIKQDPAISSTVKSLANSQAQLVQKVAQNQANLQIAATTKTTEQNIQQLITASKDQSTTSLPANSTININGQITAIGNNSLAIDKNSFLIDVNTEIQDKGGNTISLSGLAIGDTIQIQGAVENQNNLAQSINVLAKAAPKAVKPETDNSAVKAPAAIPATALVPATNTQDVSGGFINEAPVNLPGGQ